MPLSHCYTRSCFVGQWNNWLGLFNSLESYITVKLSFSVLSLNTFSVALGLLDCFTILQANLSVPSAVHVNNTFCRRAFGSSGSANCLSQQGRSSVKASRCQASSSTQGLDEESLVEVEELQTQYPGMGSGTEDKLFSGAMPKGIGALKFLEVGSLPDSLIIKPPDLPLCKNFQNLSKLFKVAETAYQGTCPEGRNE